MFWEFVNIVISTILFIFLFKFLSSFCSLWDKKETILRNIKFIFKYFIAYVVTWITYRISFKTHTLTKPISKCFESLLATEREWKLESPLIIAPNEDKVPFSVYDQTVTAKTMIDIVHFQGSDTNGNMLILRLTNYKNKYTELWLTIKYDGQVYTLPEHPNTLMTKIDNEKETFVGKGIRLEIRKPFRAWRLSINTYLRKGVNHKMSQDDSDLVHVKLSGGWHPSSEVYNFACDLEPSLTAKGLASNEWDLDFFKNLSKLNTYCTNQWGQLSCQISIGLNVSNQEINLSCLKSRCFGNNCWEIFDKFTMFVANFRNGAYMHIGSCNISGVKNLLYGYIIMPSGQIFNLTEWDILKSVDQSYSDLQERDKFVVKFSAGDTEYVLRTTIDNTLPLVVGEDNLEINMKLATFNLNGKIGYGVAGFGQKRKSHSIDPLSINQKQIVEHATVTNDELQLTVVPLSHRAAKCCQLTGGKGCNLAQILPLQNHFIVPAGLCVTTTAYKNHINAYPELKSLTDNLEEYGRLSELELNTTCSKIAEQFLTTDMLESLKRCLQNELKRHFGATFGEKHFAVRSSAVGEDSSELSTAGQLETYLEIKSLESIIESIKKCWASQFKLEAIQYRKQHGQSLTQPVGVVVQEMVEPDVSGVLFTNDPVAEDPGKIVINAHPGLGELVVSGAVIPDTITLKRSYFTNRCTVENVILGDQEKKRKCCISDDMANRLAEIGIMLEMTFGKPKDVEWAVKDDQIYILQSRDITSLNVESLHELLHEFDSAMISEEDCYTTANIGEVMPLPNSPLAIDISCLTFEKGSQVLLFTALCVLNMQIMYQDMAFWEDKDTRMMEVLFLGHTMDDVRVKQFAQNRYPKPTLKANLIRYFFMFKVLLYDLKVMMESYTKRFENYSLPDFPTTCENLFDVISSNITDLGDSWYLHILSSFRASFGYAIVANSILPRNEEWTAEHYSDISMLYSDCSDVVSADVPASLKNLAKTISKCGKSNEFRSLDQKVALEWLKSKKSGDVGEEFEQFLIKHGHRSVAELDIGVKPWSVDPLPIVTVLQNMLQNEDLLWKGKEEITIDETLSRLHHPLTSGVQKWILKKMISYARSSIAAREHTKSLGIKTIDGFRKGYVKLGRMLCDKGYLPDEDLIFFMTHSEIGELMKNRSASLVARAIRRRKIVKIQADLVYPELMFGQPKPLVVSENEYDGMVNVEIQGTPVSKGVAKGRARVAVTLEDAKGTQPGEILVARGTDIGWSPYFPLLAGVVTELGGLLSHGAVVAREYGLPCIVGAQLATSIIKTGDLVILDASKGSLKRISENDN